MTRRLPDGRWVLPDGRSVLPGNRWDLAPRDVEPPTVSVVIPFYEQQRQLDLVLAALSMQTHPGSRLQVVVADDGSSVSPDVRAFDGAVVVRQEDRGFRAAAARNLGARAADGSVLCFLDADTVPEPTYVERAVRLSAAAADIVAVGRRRHADLTGWSPDGLLAWFRGGTAPTELTEPTWLRDAYRDSADLLHADHRSYRHVISAVLTCDRDFFWTAGGFDEGFIGYGGEDWEFAARAWERGAVLAHVVDAVAWHDGPDWAERSTSDRVGKNAEALALASRITDPAARRHGIRFALPEVRVVVDTDGHSAATLLVTVGTILTELDAVVHLVGEGATTLRAAWGDADPRIVVGPPTEDARSRITMRVRRPIDAETGSLPALVAELDTARAGRLDVVADDEVIVEIRSTRADSRTHRHARALGVDAATLAEDLFPVLRRDADDHGVAPLVEEPRLDW
ncbi:glycosyltransferase [uncultured Williamsia sp.]|uniref:glycosyltransferase n=1 Tax=uncultured Williamsia sp. TaxID=259311 RepID=UPI00261926A4|nr:glycosyltransferase [uncultured Williamsia sp.]